MATIRVDSEDFRQFIDWLIKNRHIDKSWETVKAVFANPDIWLEEYLWFQEETYPKDEPEGCVTVFAVLGDEDDRPIEEVKAEIKTLVEIAPKSMKTIDEYLQFQKETYEPEIRSYKCKTCGATVTENDVKDFETAKQFGECGSCHNHPGNWGNE